MIRGGLRWGVAALVGLLCCTGLAVGQTVPPTIGLEVLVYDTEALPQDHIEGILGGMETLLSGAGCDIDFLLDSWEVLPAGAPTLIESRKALVAVSELDDVGVGATTAVALSGIDWCFAQQAIEPGTDLRNLPGQRGDYPGCSFGNGFVVDSDQPRVWLHELLHTRGQEHTLVPQFVMSENQSLGVEIRPEDCEALRRTQ